MESVAGHLLNRAVLSRTWPSIAREVLPDGMFADLFPSGRGRPSVPADVMASVILSQALHGLSDADAVDPVTFDLRWKAACGLPAMAAPVPLLDDDILAAAPGRIGVAEPDLRCGPAGRRRDRGPEGKTRRALDSTILDEAVARGFRIADIWDPDGGTIEGRAR